MCAWGVTCLTWKQRVFPYNSQWIPIHSYKLWPKSFSEHKIVSLFPLIGLSPTHIQITDLWNFCYTESPASHESPTTSQVLIKAKELTYKNVLPPVWSVLLLWFGLPAHLQMMLASSSSEEQGQITAYSLYTIQLPTWRNRNYKYCILQPPSYNVLSRLWLKPSEEAMQLSIKKAIKRLRMHQEERNPHF